ncbi:cell division transport system ATP-binding protein [Candidatus Hakubella thermalkaliphila]|uniref:Cell division ATP-binding protein FtsE n=1 Tax=Candidatus Hakubella thermalkaliphila TaxID=2754717 RepID=A0A6V8NRK9_9ACTN|nr:cell division ATP-binding protein FtsE [Candidatus Hakubella thermalkaliphila]MBT9171117.1 Cell division ATP-binding protein FtsE [Actinomycetota bacterium]GFP22683.1 cell division transport system ATP-binding protein [Candidatus Hakubella thermalkaliphila]GFP37865.1 cell division transport system ATP-binding protein [Candidatus Hakubella thermalkaliphila]
MIVFRNVTKRYGTKMFALRNVSMNVEKGEFVFLVGRSGAGKSTVIKLLLKEIEPTSGDIFVAGKNLRQLSSWKIPQLRRNIGCIFQDFKLLPNKTVFENIAFALEVIGKPSYVIQSQVPQVLQLVGLAEKAEHYPHELSAGEQQRISMARAFVNRPPLLLADEPTGNLDPYTSEGIMKLISRINKIGTTVLMATHDKALVDSVRMRVVELDEGEVVRDQEKGVYGYET